MVGAANVALRGWRLVSVFVLAVAVLGMHSMGAGHHAMASTTSPATHHVAAGAPPEGHDHLATAGNGHQHAPVTAGFSIPSDHAEAVVSCQTCSSLGAGSLGVMCLAVLSTLLGWVLLRALRQRVHGRAVPIPAFRAPLVVAVRSPLRRMALSPIEVCVLRT